MRKDLPEARRRLVLFDIDGTILHGGRLWRECFEGSIQACFEGVAFPRIAFSGKTDRQICREMIEAAGLLAGAEDAHREGRIDEVIEGYLARVRAHAPRRAGEVAVLPGAARIIDALRETPGVTLGLLTGNVREGARLKLDAVGLGDRFDFGVFGDDHWDRYRLPSIAVERALEQRGIGFAGKQVVIIGDTVHDVNCGRSIGVRSIAVGTGHTGQRELILAAGPDYFFEDLSDTEAVLRAILDEVE